MKYSGHIKCHKDLKTAINKGHANKKRGGPKKRWVQDVIEEVQMNATSRKS